MSWKHVPSQQPSETPCKIAFISEAPGDHELARGKPLVGPHGRVFDQALRVAGIERSECLITHVFDEKLPDDNVKGWCASAPVRKEWPGYDLPPIGDAGFLRPEHVHHLERLGRELSVSGATILVPLGATALWALIGNAGITERRGSTFQASRLTPRVKVLPTYSPTNAMKDWSLFHVMCADLVKAKRECEFPEVRHTKCELWLEPSLDDIKSFKERYLDEAEIISIDIETAGGLITCIGFGSDAQRAITIPFSDMRQPSRSYFRSAFDEQEAWRLVQDICGNPRPKLLQNGLYDCYWLWQERRIGIKNYRHDTRLLHHSLYPELPKSLAFMGSSYAQRGAWKTMRIKRAEKRDE